MIWGPSIPFDDTLTFVWGQSSGVCFGLITGHPSMAVSLGLAHCLTSLFSLYSLSLYRSTVLPSEHSQNNLEKILLSIGKQSINHIMLEIQENSWLAEEKLQSGNMYTNNILRFSGNIQENSFLETVTTSESINSRKNSRLAKDIIQPVYG